MNRKILHTPDGVRDIYDEECFSKLTIEAQIRKVLNSYGCRDIETPTYEYFDVFGKEVGTIPSNQLFKFFDREGNTLALRPDFTPSIARAASRYFAESGETVRLCYQGNAFVNNSNYRGRLCEVTEMGAELIGDGSVEADAEMLSMVIDAVLSAGLQEFQISLGNVNYYQALLKEAGLSDEEEEEVTSLISNKNSFGLRKMLAEKEMPENVRQALCALPMASGGLEVLEKAKALAGEDETLLASLERLEEVYHLLGISGLTRYISFDLGMMSNYMYYTGIIFRGYTYGSGEAIIKGGRYDELLSHFAADLPSIGFVVVISSLMTAMMRQKALPEKKRDTIRLLYCRENREEAILKARALREAGGKVEMFLAESEERLNELRLGADRKGIQVMRIGGKV